MTGYQMKRKIAAVLCAAMMSTSMPFGALAEAIVPDAPQDAAMELIVPQYTKIQASAEVNGTSITVHASGMSNPVIRAVLDGSDSRNMNGTRYTFENVAPGEHTVQVRYNAPDTGDYASSVITVTVAAPVIEKIEKIEKIEPPIEKIEQIEHIQKASIELMVPVEQIEKIEPVVMENVQQDQEPMAKIEQIEKLIEKAPAELMVPVEQIEKFEKIEKIESVEIGNVQQAQEPKAMIEQIENVIEKAPASLIVPEAPVTLELTEGDDDDEPVYSAIRADVKTGADSITVTILEASSEPMYVAVGEDYVKEGLYKGDSATFGGLEPGKYDVEVDYEDASNVFRTSATIEAPAAEEPVTPPSSGTTEPVIPPSSGTTESVTPPSSGAAETVNPPASDDEDEVKAFTVVPVVLDGAVSVVIDGASSREIEIVLLDEDGKKAASSAIIGNGLVQLGKFASGSYTVRAQYVTPTKDADGNYDFKTVTKQAIVPAGVTAPEQPKAVDIQAKVETGSDYMIITVTEAVDKEMMVSVEGLGDKRILKGNSVRYEGLTLGESYSIEIDYIDYIEGAKKYAATVTIEKPVVLNQIKITEVKAGVNTLTIKGTAQAGYTIQVSSEPATKADVLVVSADGKFESTLAANPGTYTKINVYYVNDASSLVSKSGSWKVSAPAAAPAITVDPVNINSKTVAVKTGANLSVTLKTGDSTKTLVSDANGLVTFSLAHTYLKGDEFTVTVAYGEGQSVSQKVTVGGIANYKDLEYGDTGDDVLRLTTRLAELGYPISPTSRYGSAVREAVELFQAANGQEADGEAGDRMQAALYSVNAIPYGANRYPTLVRGDRGLSLIYKLQQRLKDLGYYTIKVDGIFGSGTQRAVRLFQQINGLPQTGIADNATQTLLYSSAARPIGHGIPGSYSTLSRSSKYKSAVVPLQKRLKALGYYSGNIDGYFGSQTYRAVRNFQNRNGLTVTGVADPYTQQVIYSSSARPASGSSSSSDASVGYRLLYWGCRGEAVRKLQQALIDAGYKKIVRKADGIFGQWTYDAVCAYQKDKGLVVDGIAGKNTQNALYGTKY